MMPLEPKADWMATFPANSWMKNHAKILPGSRRLLKDFAADVKLA